LAGNFLLIFLTSLQLSLKKNNAERKAFWFITALSQHGERTKKPVTNFLSEEGNDFDIQWP
jgi:hypothetical protein